MICGLQLDLQRGVKYIVRISDYDENYKWGSNTYISNISENCIVHELSDDGTK